jgi:hypothetical protein
MLIIIVSGGYCQLPFTVNNCVCNISPLTTLILLVQVQMQGPGQQAQQPTLGNSFIDNNIGIEDLSASFRTIYKNMFETNPAGLSN